MAMSRLNRRVFPEDLWNQEILEQHKCELLMAGVNKKRDPATQKLRNAALGYDEEKREYEKSIFNDRSDSATYFWEQFRGRQQR